MRARRVLAYCRVSSLEQARGSSLRDQQAAIEAYAEAGGMSVARAYVEAESAVHEKIERREQIRALLNDVRPGDLVLCDKLDRWSRDPEFSYSSIRQIHERGARFYAVGDACDPSTAEGDTMLNFRVLFAREEHKRIKLRTVGTRKLLRDAGYYVEGLPPYGYRRAHPKGYRGAEKNILAVDEERIAVVRRAFRLCTSGKSLSMISAELGLTKDRVRDVLRNRVYLGEVQDSRGQWIPGKHAAVIDVDLFQRAQESLAGRRHAGARFRTGTVETSDWLLRDLATCALCGAKMAAAYAGDRDARRYYYRCVRACGRRYVPVRLVESQAEPKVAERLIALREELARAPKVDVAPASVVDFDAQLVAVHQRRKRVVDALEAGTISAADVKGRLERLDAMAMKVEAARAKASKPDALVDAAARRAALRDVREVERAWRHATRVQKRKLVGLLASSVGLAAGREPEFVWRSASELAEEVRP